MTPEELAAIRERGEHAEVVVHDLAQYLEWVDVDRRALLAEVDRLHSWGGLMSLVDEHYPADIFPRGEDREDRDTGPRIISLLAEVDRLNKENDALAHDLVEAKAELGEDDL
jgi:hypothetical protein